MKRNTVISLSLFVCVLLGSAQTGVEFGATADKEATVAKVAPLLTSPELSDVEELCQQVAADGLNDALARTKLFTLGQAVAAGGAFAKHYPALEALYVKYALGSASPVRRLFFIEQLRWFGTKRSLPAIRKLCESRDAHIAASANMTRQAIEGEFDPVTVTFAPTKARQLTDALAGANEAERFKLLSKALRSKEDLRYQAFAVTAIGCELSPEYLNKWCEVTRKRDDPRVKALLMKALGAYDEAVVFELLLEMCGDQSPAVSAVAMDILARRDLKVLRQALPASLASLNSENYKAFAAFLATLPAEVVLAALTPVYPEQGKLGKQLILEALAAHPGSDVMVKAAMEIVADQSADAKLAKAALRYLRQSAGPAQCRGLLTSVLKAKGSLRSEAAQTYAIAARQPGNEVYNRKLLESLKKGGSTPAAALLETAGRSGARALLAYVSSIASKNKEALRALTTWRDGAAAPWLMEALAKQPTDKFIARGVRQQLQNTVADTAQLQKGWKALAVSGAVSMDDLREFAGMINKASNLALRCPVSASLPQEGDHAPARMVNGDTANGEGFHSRGSPVEITVDLRSERVVASARLYFYADGRRYYQYRIDTSINNREWKLAVDKTSETRISKSEGFVLNFKPRTARYVKLTVTKNSDNPSIHVNELMLFSTPDAALIDTKKIAALTLKPDAEWNTEEIVMDGRDIKVTVNGQVIVDANLDEATKNGTMDGKEHPGLKRATGNICLCGHGDKLWFRDMRVKPLIK